MRVDVQTEVGNNMRIVKVNSYEEMSVMAAELLMKRVQQNPFLTVGLATGGTPKRMYEILVEKFRATGAPSYENVKTFNLDEYIGLQKTHENSYYYYMNKHLFSGINVKKENTNIPNGISNNHEEECQRYERLIENAGGIDLQILGIGKNGHIGFNEPGTSFTSKTHIVTLTSSTRKANERYFSSLNEVPTQAITMGIQTIMKSKEIILLASGKSKSQAIEQLLKGNLTEQFPASILNTHSNTTLLWT
nr:glucosamine-6-phosphate deaminase [Bacillus alkalisoli]